MKWKDYPFQLLTRLQIAFEDQKAFISYASHELNNPLTSIHTQIDVSLIKTRSADEYKLILKQLKQDIIRLQDLTSQLLFLSKVSAESKIGNQQTFRIDELLISLKDQIENKYSLCTINLEFDLPENQNKLCVVDNYEIIFSALYNLIENGVKYSTNQMVTVKLSTVDSILIHVENLTNLLHDEELVKFFEPFYRNENSRQQKGYGLGLSIVKKIAVVNNYFLDVSLKDGKITFTLGL
jgi:signal transduction histidine kinase